VAGGEGVAHQQGGPPHVPPAVPAQDAAGGDAAGACSDVTSDESDAEVQYPGSRQAAAVLRTYARVTERVSRAAAQASSQREAAAALLASQYPGRFSQHTPRPAGAAAASTTTPAAGGAGGVAPSAGRPSDQATPASATGGVGAGTPGSAAAGGLGSGSQVLTPGHPAARRVSSYLPAALADIYAASFREMYPWQVGDWVTG
jgi:hypothetical protein